MFKAIPFLSSINIFSRIRELKEKKIDLLLKESTLITKEMELHQKFNQKEFELHDNSMKLVLKESSLSVKEHELNRRESSISYKEKELANKEMELEELEKNLNHVIDFLTQTSHSNKNELTILHVKRTELRIWYDSNWLIVYSFNNKVERKSIVRSDGESKKELLKDLKQCKNPEDIEKLNLRDKIYYD